MDNYFNALYAIDVREKVRQKNKLNYLPWAAAWAEVKKIHPDATYHVYENEDGRFWFEDGRSGWVKCSVTIDGIENIETLAIMDHKNKAIPADEILSTDAQKSMQRALTKACGRHGLGLYIYEGEDMPEEKKRSQQKEKETIKTLRQEIIRIVKSKVEAGVNRDYLCEIIAKYNNGNANPNSIHQAEICREIIREISAAEPHLDDDVSGKEESNDG